MDGYSNRIPHHFDFHSSMGCIGQPERFIAPQVNLSANNEATLPQLLQRGESWKGLVSSLKGGMK